MKGGFCKKNIVISIICGLLVTILMIFVATVKDNTIDCKIIYDFGHEFGYEPYLYIEGKNDRYEIPPRVPEDDTYEIIYSVFEERYTIPYEAILSAESFSLQLLNCGYESRICSIEFYNHGYQVAKFSPADIQFLFDTSDWETRMDSMYICITHEGRIQLQAKELFLDELSKYPHCNQSLYLNSIFWGGIIGIFVFEFLYLKNKKGLACDSKKYLAKSEIMLALGLLIVFALACFMSLLSKHYSHPDETVTRMATDYYLSGWLRPDMNSSMVSGTFSLFGHTRLAEPNLYYLLAGKVGWVFREFFYIPTYYRMFNLLLLGVMLLFCWKKREDHTWAVVALCMTPQIWYLFSYATSDAWDWFCGFIMVYMLLGKEMYLYHQKSIKKLIRNGLVYAFIFAMILLGKTNYLVLLGVAFVDFLVGWFQQRTKKKQILILYFVILIVSFGIKIGIENLPTAKTDRMFSKQSYETGLTLGENEKEGYGVDLGHPKAEGIQLSELIVPTLKAIFESANGCYMWLSLDSGAVYYIFIFLIRIAFLVFMFNVIWRNRKGNLYINIKSVYSIFSYFLMILVVLLYCWMVTYQPQGRYLLMVWLIMGYMCAQYREIFHSKVLDGIIIACMCAGFWSFAYCGIFSMLKEGCLFVSYQKILNIIGG